MPTADYTDSDFLDRLFACLSGHLPALTEEQLAQARDAVRQHFAGERAYIPKGHTPSDREQLARDVLALFNGRNATEVARRLRIGRTTVYKIIKQPGITNRSRFVTARTSPALRSAIAKVPRKRTNTNPSDPAPWPSPKPTSTPSTPPSPAESSPSATTDAPSRTEP